MPAPEPIRVALIGDYDPTVVAHQAIPRALSLAGDALGADVRAEWVGTATIPCNDAAVARLAPFDALWCVPASPYQSACGALRAIRFARETDRPFLGTCGGFQHAVLEYARDVVGWADAAHAEDDPSAARAVVTPLSCALVEARGVVRFAAGSRLRGAYGVPEAEEGYHCRFGLNAGVRAGLEEHGLRVTATDEAGDVRGVELTAHPFFVATLFQPERAALRGEVPAIVRAFVEAAGRAICQGYIYPAGTNG
jgi:CTP synthase (UTP-ammonia lyase)